MVVIHPLKSESEFFKDKHIIIIPIHLNLQLYREDGTHRLAASFVYVQRLDVEKEV